MNRWLRALAPLLAGALLLGLTACSSGGPERVPRSWIAKTYTADAAGYSAPGEADDVADAIAKESRPRSRLTRSGIEFLRYRDHMVAIGPAAAGVGSLIEIETYTRGHQRWNQYVGSIWPAPGSAGSGYRGGGPGSGK